MHLNNNKYEFEYTAEVHNFLSDKYRCTSIFLHVTYSTQTFCQPCRDVMCLPTIPDVIIEKVYIGKFLIIIIIIIILYLNIKCTLIFVSNQSTTESIVFDTL